MDPFIVDDAEDILDDVGNEDEEDELFDTACAICDNGGELLWYELFVGYPFLYFHLNYYPMIDDCRNLGFLFLIF